MTEDQKHFMIGAVLFGIVAAAFIIRTVLVFV